MHDDPAATEHEQEQSPERLDEELAKSGAGHEDPRQVEDPDDE
ncbi:MAG: hypothetical protein ACJ747_00510 [Gaiellaceae bacterium]|jgi:hypothetical protein